MTERVVDKDEKPLQSSDLVGLKATLMFEVKGSVKGYVYKYFEQVDQVS